MEKASAEPQPKDKDLEYITAQNDAFDKEKTGKEASLFALIAENYKTYFQPTLGHLIPSPGVPCALQVILSCYQPLIAQHILKAMETDAVYHRRFFRA